MTDLISAPRARTARRPRVHGDAAVLAAVAAGGVIGALIRYAIAGTDSSPDSFPLPTFGINVSGCLAIGILLTITEMRSTPRLVRPFLGTGLLGGFTTFSTYAAQTGHLLSAHPVLATLYVFGTAAAALVAVQAGVVLARRLLSVRA